MQITKLILSLLLFKSMAQASELKARFLESTKLVEGTYQLVRGDQSCQQGPLKIVDLENELTLMLGANPLVRGIGLENNSTQERGCTTKVSGRFDGSKISGELSYVCDRLGGAETQVEVSVNGDEISYTRKTTRGKRTQKDSCVLKRARP